MRYYKGGTSNTGACNINTECMSLGEKYNSKKMVQMVAAREVCG